MSDENIEPKVEEPKKDNLAVAELVSFSASPGVLKNPWKLTAEMLTPSTQGEFQRIVRKCRFFYKKDPLSSTTINKLVELGINNLVFAKNGLSENEFRIFTGLRAQLLQFAEDLALEFLLSGLVVPEVSYTTKTRDEVKRMGVKKYDTLELPNSLWVRDPCSIEIRQILDQPQYLVTVPDSMMNYIQKRGIFPDGSQNDKLYLEMKANYPDFVNKIMEGQRQVELNNPFVIRRRVLQDSPYPVPYLSSALDILEHKRNMRKADYSVVTKVLSAILQIKVGSDQFPMTDSEEDEERLIALKNQLRFRESSRYGYDMDSVFQLFTDHTTTLQWVFPDVNTLLNETKYAEVNDEIIFALGFPRTLLDGEPNARAGTLSAEYAAIGPIRTMESFRIRILPIIQEMVYQISTRNNFSSVPNVDFEPINIHDFAVFISALQNLYGTGALSRTSLAKMFGYNFEDELETRVKEEKAMADSGVPEFAPLPNSRTPQNSRNTVDKTKANKPTISPKKNSNDVQGAKKT
jgi:hypothetical protein